MSLVAALAGGVLAMLVAGGTVWLGSLAGWLAVLAIAVRNGILLINRYQRLEGGGRGLRSGARPAWRARAARADPDERDGDWLCRLAVRGFLATSPVWRSCIRWRWSSWAVWWSPQS